jgi:hypothetical protein
MTNCNIKNDILNILNSHLIRETDEFYASFLSFLIKNFKQYDDVGIKSPANNLLKRRFETSMGLTSQIKRKRTEFSSNSFYILNELNMCID